MHDVVFINGDDCLIGYIYILVFLLRSDLHIWCFRYFCISMTLYTVQCPPFLGYPFPPFRVSTALSYNFSFYYRSELHLTFEESVFGGKREIEVPCLETCGVCGGTGAKSANCIKSCTDCGGRGRIMKSQKTPFGVVSQVILQFWGTKIWR